jgi:hypothetical protein
MKSVVEGKKKGKRCKKSWFLNKMEIWRWEKKKCCMRGKIIVKEDSKSKV